MTHDICVMASFAFGWITADLLIAIGTRIRRRWRLPKTRTWLETVVLSPDGPIELKNLKYSWARGYDVTLQWDDIDRTATTRHKRLTSPLHLRTFVEGVKSGVFLATATESPSTTG